MPNKEPLLTRAKIREMKKQESKLAKLKEIEIRKEYEDKEKKISQEITKEKKKLKTVKCSRSQQSEKYNERSSFLNKAIVVVVILLLLVLIAVKYL